MSGSPLKYCCISANCEAVQHFKASAFRHRCSDYWSKHGFTLVFTGWEYPSLTPTINSVGKSYFLTRIAEQTAQSCDQDGSFNDLTEKEVKAGFRFGWKMWAITRTLKCRQETSEIQPRWSRENDFSSFLAILTGKGVDFRSFDDISVLNCLQEESNALHPNAIRWAVLPEHGVAENLWRNICGGTERNGWADNIAPPILLGRGGGYASLLYRSASQCVLSRVQAGWHFFIYII